LGDELQAAFVAGQLVHPGGGAHLVKIGQDQAFSALSGLTRIRPMTRCSRLAAASMVGSQGLR
jgi:hypothetical protein